MKIFDADFLFYLNEFSLQYKYWRAYNLVISRIPAKIAKLVTAINSNLKVVIILGLRFLYSESSFPLLINSSENPYLH